MSKTCRVGVLWSRGEGHTQLDGAHADKLTMSQFWGKITQGDTTASGSLPSLPSSRRKRFFRSYLHKTAAAVSRAFCHLEEKVISDRIYTRQQRPSWQVNILVLVRASNAALLCDGDVVSSLVFRFSHPKPHPFILRPHPPLTSDL